MGVKIKKTSPLLIIAVTLAVGSLIYILNVGGARFLLIIARLIYVALINTPGEDLAAIYLIAIVFSLGGVVAMTALIPRMELNDKKLQKIAGWLLQVVRVGLALIPVVVALAVSIKLSPWFVVPVAILALSCSVYIIVKYGLLKPLKRKPKRD